jgi:RNA polymerase sigma-70 factor (ECF subfamily)
MTLPTPFDAAAPDILPDEEIVRRVRAGERDLYELLMRRHNQRVYRAIRAVVRDEAEVEDVMQQAYVLAYFHLDQFAGMARFSTWLVRIAINEALRRARTSPYLVLVTEADSEEAGAAMNKPVEGRTPEDEAESREMVGLVERAIDGLPEIYRRVVVLREIEGLSTAEVADVLRTSEDVVKTRLHRARALLQSQVRTSHADLSSAFPFGAQRCDRIVAAVMALLTARG